MNQTTLTRFVEELHGDGGPTLDDRRLREAKRRGTRRRRVRLAATGAAAVAVLAGGTAVTVPLVTGGDARTTEDTRPLDVVSRPDGLSALQERVLTEVPGAERISVWQVVLPEPAGAVDTMEIPGDRVQVQGERFATGVPSRTGVTVYERSGFPGWLYDAILDIEQDAGDGNSYPVGSTDMGIAVENGTLELACVGARPSRCSPAVIRNEGGELHYQWGFGTDEFLDPGTGMEVFAGDPGAEDAPSLSVAGLPDDSVTRVEFVNTAGEVVDGRVDHTMAPGSSILWAAVPGALARVVAYDADGGVVEDHTLRACSGGVDCEVR